MFGAVRIIYFFACQKQKKNWHFIKKMIPKAIIHIINKYNEVGILLHKQNDCYWFNGFRFELMKEKTFNYYECLLIQIQIKTKTHSYILSKNKISHFNGEKWKTLKVDNLPVVNTTNIGAIYYSTSSNKIILWKETQTNNHGTLFCVKSFNNYLIDLDGNLSIIFPSANIWNLTISTLSNMKVFGCSDHWE